MRSHSIIGAGPGVFIPGHRVASTLAGASVNPARAAFVVDSTEPPPTLAYLSLVM
jgi:hypothetical protein